MEAKTKETTAERLKWHINHLEEIGQDFDSISWGMQAGILITGNEAKEFLALYERVRELKANLESVNEAFENYALRRKEKGTATLKINTWNTLVFRMGEVKSILSKK